MFFTDFKPDDFLFAFILIGYILSKMKVSPDNSATVLSKLENFIFVPALVIGTFMGNAIMTAVFPEIFFEYTIFTLPFWFMIYLYGAPVLLIAGDSNGEKKSISSRLKSFINPMFIGMLIGMVLGLTGLGLKLPSSIQSVINVSGNCMSPVAMLLTGMTIAKVELLTLLKKWRLYILTAIKLLVYPALAIGVCLIFPNSSLFSLEIKYCLICFSCMPFGLNGIVIPAAYGRILRMHQRWH